MRLNPEKQCAPRYPTAAEASADKKLLLSRPERWKSSGVAALAFAALGASALSSCNASSNKSVINSDSVISSAISSSENLEAIATLGDLVPYYGYFSESAAADIITSELANSGISATLSVGDFDISFNIGKREIFIEYICGKGCGDAEDESSVTAYPLVKQSENGKSEIRETADGESAVLFIQPLDENDTDGLRAQVAEFAEWLQTQGLA